MNPFLRLYKDLASHGEDVAIRGSLVKELENYVMDIAESECVSSFRARNLNLNYCKAEFDWYMGADRFDTSIEEHATMWKKLKDVDGGFNSNYGCYLFDNSGHSQGQFQWCVRSLLADPHSRQANIVLLQPHHLRHDNPDIVCTQGINFRIRHGRLNMTVTMRSNDAIFGTTNDVFCFSMIHRHMLCALTEFYRDLVMGDYTHFVCSMHVYERHFDMLDKLVADSMNGFHRVSIPRATLADFEFLRAYRIGMPPASLKFATWIRTRD